MSHFKLSELNKSVRILARIEFKDLTFNKFKFSPPFLQFSVLKSDWLTQMQISIHFDQLLSTLLSHYYITNLVVFRRYKIKIHDFF